VPIEQPCAIDSAQTTWTGANPRITSSIPSLPPCCHVLPALKCSVPVHNIRTTYEAHLLSSRVACSYYYLLSHALNRISYDAAIVGRAFFFVPEAIGFRWVNGVPATKMNAVTIAKRVLLLLLLLCPVQNNKVEAPLLASCCHALGHLLRL
jgi:hypothetical protein